MTPPDNADYERQNPNAGPGIAHDFYCTHSPCRCPSGNADDVRPISPSMTGSGLDPSGRTESDFIPAPSAEYVAPRPRLLDLFCCAGGAAMGYHRAGFEVVGVDIAPQPNYPFEFHQADALTFPLEGFDVVHASPPCQSYSDLAKRNANGHEWPRLINPMRERLLKWGGPYVIENVDPCEDLIAPIRLCGTMFPGLRVIRHRLFESNVHPVLLNEPPHPKHPLVFTHDKRKAHYGKLDQNVSFVQVTGGGNATIANKRAAMGCDWMNNHELNEAIPPAYTEYIGRLLMDAIDWVEVAA